jgi:hypothetical protein
MIGDWNSKDSLFHLEDNRSMFAPKGKTTRSPWQRHGIDSL